jgi:hypothetical protein
MSILLLRTLTAKSIIGFGAYTDISVQNLLDTYREKELLQIYYNCRNIDYCKELKERLGITPEREINKKEKREERFSKDTYFLINACLHEIIKDKTEEERLKELGMKRKFKFEKKKTLSISQTQLDKTIFSKGALRSKNQW